MFIGCRFAITANSCMGESTNKNFRKYSPIGLLYEVLYGAMKICGTHVRRNNAAIKYGRLFHNKKTGIAAGSKNYQFIPLIENLQSHLLYPSPFPSAYQQ